MMNKSEGHNSFQIIDKPNPSEIDTLQAKEITTNNTRSFILQCIKKARKSQNSTTTNTNTTTIATINTITSNNSNIALQNATNQDIPYPHPRLVRFHGILKNGSRITLCTPTKTTHNFIIAENLDEYWDKLTSENNNCNIRIHEQWQANNSLSRTTNTTEFYSLVNSYWSNINDQHNNPEISAPTVNTRRVRIAKDEIHRDYVHTHQLAPGFTTNDTNHTTHGSYMKRKASHESSQHNPEKSAKQSNISIFNKVKNNLHLRAQQKITRIANWNINNGFDHLAIATIMAKNDIDILAIQEPRTSTSPKDDVWIATMRKELRKCKYELITSKFSYLIFDEQTSGASLASIIRHESKVQGRILSITFKSNDMWEVHTVISIYAVTNPNSTNKYAHSKNSRKDTNKKVTKALLDEITYLRRVYGEAPITVTGDFQDTLYSDTRDNIGITGKKMNANGPLQLLIDEGYTSAYHSLHPNTQQVTRWNNTKTAGRHIDIQMMNPSAASLLSNITIDSTIAQNHIKSDHLLVVADYKIQKTEQDIVNNYRMRINFNKISRIKMRLNTKVTQCPTTNTLLKQNTLAFDDSQFMSCVAQNSLTSLQIWQEHASTAPMNDILQSLENTLTQLEMDMSLEDNHINAQYDPLTSPVQRKLIERTSNRRDRFDGAYNKFHDAIAHIASQMNIITSENRQVDALCNRQLMKDSKLKWYGEKIVPNTAPTSKIRTALGDLKQAEATLRNLNRNLLPKKIKSTINATDQTIHRSDKATNEHTQISIDNNKENHHLSNIASDTITEQSHDRPSLPSITSVMEIRNSLTSLATNSRSLKNLFDGMCHLSEIHEENARNEDAISQHRVLDSYSGRWSECRFSADICHNILSQTNGILKDNNVKQQIGMRQLDSSSNHEDAFSNITQWWNGPDLENITSLPATELSSQSLHDHINQAIKNVRKLRKKAFHSLIHNKEKMLLHEARLNNTRNTSQRTNPKIMEEPEAHHVILDQDDVHAKSDNRCTSFQQCLDNTLLYHQNWMDRSGSQWEHHWFRLASKYGRTAGITFLPSIRPTDADCKLLIKGYDKCPKKIIQAFQDAHSDQIFNIMQPPQTANRALEWQWHPNSTADQWDTFQTNYWKAIASVPGKARHAGYTTAIIGRLPIRWIDVHLRLMKISLILRMLPQRTKIQSRVPIPKPKPGETRPLSLLHDDMCFLLGFITKHYARRCEDIKLFPPSIRAYRQGMSTSFITLLDLSVREDAVTFGRMMALTSEDEEKFFDRVSLDVQLAILTILGFPTEGFLEIKAEEMDNISVEIHTRHGTIIGKFLHGLKQGSPLSCLLSNLVLIFKHRIWNLQDPLAKQNDPNGYTMTQWNHSIDGPNSPLVSMEGFCDDNSKWNMGDGTDFRTLVRAVQWNLKMAGDLSMIFKIGRRGDKTIIELFNIAWDDVYLLPPSGFTSIAWDFKANMPTEEEVDCRVYLIKGCTIPTSKPIDLSDQVWSMITKGLALKSERTLGVWRNKVGDTTDSAQKRAFLLGSRIDRLNLSTLKSDRVIQVAVNSLVVPIYQFGILENKCSPDTYDAMDVVLLNKIRTAMGFAWCDAKQLLFVSEANFGMGIKSISVEMLKSICRELEVQLNDDNLVGKILRSRLAAYHSTKTTNELAGSMITYEGNNQGTRNMVMEAVRHIATYGFYLRDMSDFQTSYCIETAIILAQQGTLFRTFTNGTIGMNSFDGIGSRSGTTLGAGDRRLLWASLYGRGHMILAGTALPSPYKLNLSIQQISDIRNQASSMLHDDIQALYTVFEWTSNTENLHTANCFPPTHYLESINRARNWRRISAMSNLLGALNNDDNLYTTKNNLFDDLPSTNREELLEQIDQLHINPNRLRLSQVEHLLTDGWPLIIATDGGAVSDSCSDTTYRHASAGVVILHPPAIPYAIYSSFTKQQQSQIMNSNLLPWRARATPLPQSIGDQIIDNAHAECMAIILMEEWLPRGTPVLLIMDSEAERSRYHELRHPQNTTNRFLIRSIMSGVSKNLGTRLARAIAFHQTPSEVQFTTAGSSLFELCNHAKQWCFTSNGEQSSWNLSQWDIGTNHAIWAIRSHQLTESFSISPKNRYKDHLVPNRAFVSANQWADNICNAILRFQRNATFSKQPPELRRWLLPNVTLGITGPVFILTHRGKCLDRSVTTAVEHACDLEFIKRIASRPTQGLILRLKDAILLKPEMIGRQSYLRRSLEGKTKTHTRAMYVDSTYRKAFVQQCIKQWGDPSDSLVSALKLATKSYKYLRCPCCITILHHENTTTLNDNTKHPSNLLHLQHGPIVNSGLYANLRHYRFYCLHPTVCDVRQKMTQLLEEHLTGLLKTAAQWGKNGFSTLLTRVVDGLITLDRKPFHNAATNNLTYEKSKTSQRACLTGDEWILFVESNNTPNSSLAYANFIRWPLVHQFAFIPANS